MNFLRLASLAGLATAMAAPFRYGLPVIRTHGYPVSRCRRTGAAVIRRRARKARHCRRHRRA